MRIALLSALADTTASAGERPALRRFAGKTVLAHQIDCAAHLGCEKLVCLATGAGPEIANAKSYAERSGLKLEVAQSHAQVMAQVTASDEAVLFADGVLSDRAAVVAAIKDRSGVIAFPDEPALERGFERLDAARAWSGVLRTRGDAVARLADLPPDCDLSSSLLRIALQQGTRVIDIDPAAITSGVWQRRVERQASQATEWRWIAQQIGPAPFTAPALAVAERAGIRWAHDAGGGRWALGPHAVAVAMALGASASWWFGWPVLGLTLLTLGLAALAIATVFARVEDLGRPPRRAGPWRALAKGLGDGLLALLLSALCMTVPSWLGSVLPIVLVLLLRLAEATAPPLRAPLFCDRILLSATLVPIAYAGVTLPAVLLGTVAIPVALLWWARPQGTRITAN